MPHLFDIWGESREKRLYFDFSFVYMYTYVYTIFLHGQFFTLPNRRTFVVADIKQSDQNRLKYILVKGQKSYVPFFNSQIGYFYNKPVHTDSKGVIVIWNNHWYISAEVYHAVPEKNLIWDRTLIWGSFVPPLPILIAKFLQEFV